MAAPIGESVCEGIWLPFVAVELLFAIGWLLFVAVELLFAIVWLLFVAV